MKGDDLQRFLLSKYEKGEPSTKFFEDLNGLWALEPFDDGLKETGTINLSHTLGCPRIIRTKGMIQKVKKRMKRKKSVNTKTCRWTGYF